MMSGGKFVVFFDRFVAIFGKIYGSLIQKFGGHFFREGGKALVAGPLKKIFFCGFSKECHYFFLNN